MKKMLYIIPVLFIIVIPFLVGVNDNKSSVNTYYMVSYKGEQLGLVESEKKLLSYIDSKQNEIKEKYLVDQVDIPADIYIQKVVTYDKNIENIKDMYSKIIQKTNFSIEGYKVSIAGKNGEKNFNITKYEILEESIKNIINVFVGEEAYNNYLNGTQSEIETLGTYIESIYVENEITTKKEKISVDETIYFNAKDLTYYLLYGEEGYSKKYVASIGDTVESISFKNKISVDEFLMSNPSIINSESLLYPGQEVTIGVIDPQIQITVEQLVTEEAVLNYKSIETVDENRLIGDDEIIIQGENGILKVTSNEKITNGISVYVKQLSTELLKPAIDRVMIKGGKKVSGVGSLKDWAWPVDHVRITDRFGWRINPVTFKRHLHDAVDFASPYGAPIYAANNGVVTIKGNVGTCGKTVEINHNNGYYSVYCHMSKYGNITKGQAVEKGQIIGYIGMTGNTTGPHLHFGIWKGGRAWSGTPIDPLTLYK